MATGLKTLSPASLLQFSCYLFNRTWKQQPYQELLENIKKQNRTKPRQNYWNDWELLFKLPYPFVLRCGDVRPGAFSCYWDTSNEHQCQRHPHFSQGYTEAAATVWDFWPSHSLSQGAPTTFLAPHPQGGEEGAPGRWIFTEQVTKSYSLGLLLGSESGISDHKYSIWGGMGNIWAFLPWRWGQPACNSLTTHDGGDHLSITTTFIFRGDKELTVGFRDC